MRIEFLQQSPETQQCVTWSGRREAGNQEWHLGGRRLTWFSFKSHEATRSAQQHAALTEAVGQQVRHGTANGTHDQQQKARCLSRPRAEAGADVQLVHGACERSRKVAEWERAGTGLAKHIPAAD